MSQRTPPDRRRFLRDSAIAAAVVRLAQDPGDRRAGSPRSLSRQFAQWVVGLRFEDLPPAVVDRAKGLTLQNLASALLGSQMPAGQQAVRFIAGDEAGVPGG